MICNRLHRSNLIRWSVGRCCTGVLLRCIGSGIVVRGVKIRIGLHDILHELPRLWILERESLRDRIASIDNRLGELLPGWRQRVQILLTSRQVSVRHRYRRSITRDGLRLHSIGRFKRGRLRHTEVKKPCILLILGIGRFGWSLKADAAWRKTSIGRDSLMASQSKHLWHVVLRFCGRASQGRLQIAAIRC